MGRSPDPLFLINCIDVHQYEVTMTTLAPENVHEAVRQRYSSVVESFQLPLAAAGCCQPATAANTGSCCDDSDCGCGSDLYTADISWLPNDVTGLSLGCGDPITLAGLETGQSVLDLGSGAGIDVFMAARQVGPEGYVIGVDMTPAMLEKANRNKAQLGLDNVEFRQGYIEALPVEDNTIDVAISNCVINLSPDKAAVFRELFRVLRPGGRVAVSDMVTQGKFSAQERADASAWAGCITGAEDVADYVAAMRAAGFVDIGVQDKAAPDVELAGSAAEDGPPRLFSARVTAVKPPRN
jgi:SAM-dependent methyltransferase